MASASTIYEFSPALPNGRAQPLAEYRGQVLLVVNVASRCGFTPQYAALERLYTTYRSQGFAVLGFPCNQFGAQEPGDAEEIRNFCTLNYAVDFPLFAKIDVNGPTADPLYEWLKAQKRGFLGFQTIKWNFTKFLVARDGRVAGRYGPNVAPESLKSKIEALLVLPT